MEKLLSEASGERSCYMSFLRHKQNRFKIKKLWTKIQSSPYLINIFLVSCSPAELIYSSVDKNKCKAILGLKFNCKQVSGLSINKC